jgi:ribonuclease T2
MKLLTYFQLFCCLSTVCFANQVIQWDYFLFVQLWPGSWLHSDHSNYVFTNNYFTIHGLWPEYKNGSWPQFCNASKFNVTTLDPINQSLVKYWTDFKNPEQFWSHEYYKHLSCLEEDPIFNNEYTCFNTGLKIRSNINYFSYLKDAAINPSNDHNYTVQSISTVIHKHINVEPIIVCDTSGILNEIRICISPSMNIVNCPMNEIKKGCQRKMVWYNLITS